MKAVDEFLESRSRFQCRINLATLYAHVLATEYFVCAGIGFTKYLN